MTSQRMSDRTNPLGIHLLERGEDVDRDRVLVSELSNGVHSGCFSMKARRVVSSLAGACDARPRSVRER